MEVKEPDLCGCVPFNGRNFTSQNVTVEWSALIPYFRGTVFCSQVRMLSTLIFNVTLLTLSWQNSGIVLFTYFLHSLPSRDSVVGI